MTFGYARAEVVAALVNYTTLIVIGLYLAAEAVGRFFAPEPVDGWIVVWIAGAALVIDLVTALLTYSLSKSSVNIRAAFLHNVADALGSVAVIFAGTLILLYDWRLIDPAVTLMIAGYILWQSFAEIGGVIRIALPKETADDPEGPRFGDHEGAEHEGPRAGKMIGKLCAKVECTDEQRSALEAKATELHAGAPDHETMKAKRDAAQRALADAFRGDAFSAADADAFATYRSHPDHVAVIGELIEPICAERVSVQFAT